MNLRDALPGFYERDDYELREIWREALIVFDTNVFLDLYRLDESSREDVMQILRSIDSKRLWLPYTVAVEFHQNRKAVIMTELEKYKRFQTGLEEEVEALKRRLSAKIDEFRKHPRTVRRHPFLSKTKEIGDSIDAYCSHIADPLAEIIGQNDRLEVERYTKMYEALLEHDTILEEIALIYESRLGTPIQYDSPIDWETLADFRLRNKIPPGYEDRNKGTPRMYSDIFIWHEMMSEAKTSKHSMIFVSNDAKEDWWLRDGSKLTGPRPELLNEFVRETDRYVQVYSLDRFIELSQRYSLLGFEKLKLESLRTTYEDIRLLKETEMIVPEQLLELVSVIFGSTVVVAPSDKYGELVRTILEAINELNDMERAVLTARFGLRGETAKSIENLVSEYAVSEEELREVEARAIRRLRHPKRSRKIRSLVELDGD